MFTPIKSTKVYEQVIEQIKEMIVSGKLKKGDRLPPERDLVEQLQASRTSIREAIRALQIIGLIECKHGGGNFIKHSFENSLFEPLSIMFVLQNSKPFEILELRKIIEVETVALAAERISHEELIELEAIINQLKVSYDDEEKSAKLDKEFHYKVAQASGNFLIVSLLEAVSSLLDSFIKDARQSILRQNENKLLIQHHENIYKALLAHDRNKAAEVMRKHLDFINDYLSKEK